MKTVLIAGATGYLGRHLCAEYERRGLYVVALARNAAPAGRVWLFAPGTRRIIMIQGADFAAQAFDALAKRTRMGHLPDALRGVALVLLPAVTPSRISGPARFFLAAIGMDMVGAPRGTRHLADHFQALARDAQDQTVS